MVILKKTDFVHKLKTIKSSKRKTKTNENRKQLAQTIPQKPTNKTQNTPKPRITKPSKLPPSQNSQKKKKQKPHLLRLLHRADSEKSSKR